MPWDFESACATVEAFAASWIEMFSDETSRSVNESKPLRLRGLKLLVKAQIKWMKPVEAFAASWIEIPCGIVKPL